MFALFFLLSWSFRAFTSHLHTGLFYTLGEGTTVSRRQILEKQGRGIHHLGFMVEDMRETLGKFGKMGIGVGQKAEYKGGRCAYVDSRGRFAAMIEILHIDG